MGFAMLRKLKPSWIRAFGAILILLAVQISVVSIGRYVTQSMDAPPPILENGLANPFLAIHVVSSVIALLIGPLQFWPVIRVRWPALHRANGRLYAAACAVGAPTAFLLALGTTAGPSTALAFAIPAVLWPIFTWIGIRSATARRFADHREWMLRSYAITANAITLRLMLPTAAFLGYEFLPAYQVIAWLSWTTTLLLCEIYIVRTRSSATRHPVFAVA